VAIGKGAPLFRGLLETGHVLYRTVESHDPTRFGVSISADDLPCAKEGVHQRSPRVASLLLQLRKASPGAEIRIRGPDAGHAGRMGHQATDVQGDLLLDDAFFALQNVTFVFFDSTLLVSVADRRLSLAA
jgi:hypothetical protein